MTRLKSMILILAATVAASTILSSCCGQLGGGKQPDAVPKAAVDSASYMFGYSSGMQMLQSNTGPLDQKMFLKGVEDALSGVEVEYADFNRIITEFLNVRSEAIGAEIAKRSQERLAEVKKTPGVGISESGLVYLITEPGNDVRATSQDTVEVHYEGKNLDDKVFDSSYQRGVPAKFPLNGVIKGWTEGLQLVGEGGEITLWIPADLAYGNSNMGADIRPNEALEFNIKVLSISKYVPRE